jgi:hypothetical protein
MKVCVLTLARGGVSRRLSYGRRMAPLSRSRERESRKAEEFRPEECASIPEAIDGRLLPCLSPEDASYCRELVR